MSSTPPTDESAPQPGLLHRALREPLLQFLLLGAALFVVSALLSHWRGRSEQRIVIDAPLVAWQRNLYHAQFGTWPDSEALEALIQNYIRDESLYREAVRLGLGADDEVVRQRLAQKMEYVLTDATQPPEPDEATLQQYLDAHIAQYTEPGRVSFQLLYFADTPDREGGRERATAALQKLTFGATDVHGDPFALDENWSAASADDLIRRFGDSEMAGAPLKAPLETWSGPYRSGYGWHLVRVSAREATRAPTLVSIHDQVQNDWLADFRQRDLDARIAELIGKHQVVRLDREAAQ
jgi:hypothetical protein